MSLLTDSPAAAELSSVGDQLADALESELEDGFEVFTELEGDAFWPVVLRAVASGAGPLFRVVGRRLTPAVARRFARRMPGVFVRGTKTQARSFARKIGGRLVPAERHGSGLPHYHLVFPNGRRIHVWYGRRVPTGDFFGT